MLVKTDVVRVPHLKMLTKIIYPDTGSIEMCGRVSSLLELGAGFPPRYEWKGKHIY